MRFTPVKWIKAKKRTHGTCVLEKASLLTAMTASYSSRTKKSNDLPIVIFFSSKNIQHESGWLRMVLNQNGEAEAESLTLIYCFFLGFKNDTHNSIYANLEHAFGKRKNGQLVTATILDILCKKVEELGKNDISCSSLLTKAIKETVNQGSSDPLHQLFFEKNKTNAGWLLFLFCGHRREMDMTDTARFIAACLYNITRGCCQYHHIESLADAFGKNNTNNKNKKRDFIRTVSLKLSKDRLNKEKEAKIYESDNITLPTVSTTTASKISSRSKRQPSICVQDNGEFTEQVSPLTIRSEYKFFPLSSQTPSPSSARSPAPKTQSMTKTQSPDSPSVGRSLMITAATSLPSKMMAPLVEQSIYSPEFNAVAQSMNTYTINDVDDNGDADISFDQVPSKLFSANLSPTISFSPAHKKGRVGSTPYGQSFEQRMSPSHKLRVCMKNTADDKKIRSAAIEFLLDTSNLVDQDTKAIVHSVVTASTDYKVKEEVIKFLSKKTKMAGNVKFVASRDKMMIEVIKPRYKKEKATDDAIRKDVEKRGEEIKSIIDILVGDVGRAKQVFSYIFSTYYDSQVFFEMPHKQKLSILECIAIRNRGGPGISNNAIQRVLRDVVRFLNRYDMLRVVDPLEGRLRTKLGKAESNGAIPIDFKLVACETKKDKTEECVFYWIQNVPLLLERLVSTCVLEGCFQTSFEFSSFVQKDIYAGGPDRGGGDIINALRYVGRVGGNTGRHTIPFGVVEKAAETLANLEKTIFSKERKEIQQQLIGQELYLFHFCFLKDYKCLIVKFIGNDIELKTLRHSTIECFVGLPQNIDIQDHFLFDSYANNRTQVDEIALTPHSFEQRDDAALLKFKITPIVWNGAYIGVKITRGEKTLPLLKFAFDDAVEADRIESTTCNQVIYIPAVDGKMTATLSGLSTCGVKYSCPRCLWKLSSKKLPMWLHREGSFSAEECEDFPLRVGENNKDSSYNKFVNLVGEKKKFSTNKELSDRVKEACKSVTRKPVFRIPDDLLYLYNGGHMHISQGLMRHLTEENAMLLNATMEGTNSWYETQLEECLQYINMILESRKQDVQIKEAIKKFNRAQKKMTMAEQSLAKAYKDKDNIQIQIATQEMEKSVVARNEIEEETNFVFLNRQLKGAIELKELIVGSKKQNRDMKHPTFVFLKAVKAYGGHFNQQHGGSFELTNRRGVKVLENRKDVFDKVVNSEFSDDAVKAKVTAVMEWWLGCAEELYHISIALLDQTKQDDTKIRAFKKRINNFVHKWISKVEKNNPVFWKLHMLMCGVVHFVETTRMTSRPDEQGGENKHFELTRLKETMGTIAQNRMRCEKMSQRQQLMLIKGISEPVSFLEKEDELKRRGTRGKYNIEKKRTKISEQLPSEDLMDDAPEEFFLTDQDNYVPMEWYVFYTFLRFGKVPEEWNQSFVNDKEFGNVATSSTCYI